MENGNAIQGGNERPSNTRIPKNPRPSVSNLLPHATTKKEAPVPKPETGATPSSKTRSISNHTNKSSTCRSGAA
jgi:hypothetical protein